MVLQLKTGDSISIFAGFLSVRVQSELIRCSKQNFGNLKLREQQGSPFFFFGEAGGGEGPVAVVITLVILGLRCSRSASLLLVNLSDFPLGFHQEAK